MTSAIEPNALDRIIGWLWPTTAAKRLAARVQQAQLLAAERVWSSWDERSRVRTEERRAMYSAGHGGYDSAETSRIQGDRWRTARTASADADTLDQLDDLRNRSRHLNRNDAIASGLTGLATDSSIGIGLQPQSRLNRRRLRRVDASMTDERIEEIQDSIEDVIERWMPFADAQDRMTFFDMQALIVRKILEDGEVFLNRLFIDDAARPYGLAFEVVEADRIDTPISLVGKQDIRAGVELGARGEPVAYYVLKDHPGDAFGLAKTLNREYSRIERMADGHPRMMHLYWIRRPGQTRGVPWFAPVMNYFADHADYAEAEIVGARVAACITAAVTKIDPAFSLGAMPQSKTQPTQRLTSMSPGAVAYLAPGENVTLLDPHRPNSNYDAFIARVLRSICVSLGIPYECLDFASTNYSSARAALIEARKFYKKLQSYVVVHFCRPAILLLLEEAWSRGELDFDFPANRNLWAQMRWLPLTGWGWVDPTKEVEAAGRAIEIGISTRADEAAALGRDYEEIVWQQQREQEMRAAAGLRAEPIAVTDSEDDGA